MLDLCRLFGERAAPVDEVTADAHRGRLVALGEPTLETLQNDVQVELASGNFQAGIEVMELLEEPVLSAFALGDHALAAVQQ